MMTLEQIREIIEKHGTKQCKIAEFIGVNPTQMTAILKGKRKIQADEYVKFCEFYGLDMTGAPIKA